MTTKGKRIFWKQVTGVAMIATAVAIPVGIGYQMHQDRKQQVYELMHEVEHCEQAAAKYHHNQHACMWIKDQLADMSQNYF